MEYAILGYFFLLSLGTRVHVPHLNMYHFIIMGTCLNVELVHDFVVEIFVWGLFDVV